MPKLTLNVMYSEIPLIFTCVLRPNKDCEEEKNYNPLLKPLKWHLLHNKKYRILQPAPFYLYCWTQDAFYFPVKSNHTFTVWLLKNLWSPIIGLSLKIS